MTQDDASKDAILTRQLLREELDASNSYQGKANASADPDAKALYNDISREEKVHAGELSQLLSKQDPDGAKAQQEGMREAEGIVKSAVQKAGFNWRTGKDMAQNHLRMAHEAQDQGRYDDAAGRLINADYYLDKYGGDVANIPDEPSVEDKEWGGPIIGTAPAEDVYNKTNIPQQYAKVSESADAYDTLKDTLKEKGYTINDVDMLASLFGKSNAQKAEWLGLSTDNFETSLKKAMMQKSGYAGRENELVEGEDAAFRDSQIDGPVSDEIRGDDGNVKPIVKSADRIADQFESMMKGRRDKQVKVDARREKTGKDWIRQDAKDEKKADAKIAHEKRVREKGEATRQQTETLQSNPRATAPDVSAGAYNDIRVDEDVELTDKGKAEAERLAHTSSEQGDTTPHRKIKNKQGKIVYDQYGKPLKGGKTSKRDAGASDQDQDSRDAILEQNKDRTKLSKETYKATTTTYSGRKPKNMLKISNNERPYNLGGRVARESEQTAKPGKKWNKNMFRAMGKAADTYCDVESLVIGMESIIKAYNKRNTYDNESIPPQRVFNRQKVPKHQPQRLSDESETIFEMLADKAGMSLEDFIRANPHMRLTPEILAQLKEEYPERYPTDSKGNFISDDFIFNTVDANPNAFIEKLELNPKNTTMTNKDRDSQKKNKETPFTPVSSDVIKRIGLGGTVKTRGGRVIPMIPPKYLADLTYQGDPDKYDVVNMIFPKFFKDKMLSYLPGSWTEDDVLDELSKPAKEWSLTFSDTVDKVMERHPDLENMANIWASNKKDAEAYLQNKRLKEQEAIKGNEKSHNDFYIANQLDRIIHNAVPEAMEARRKYINNGRNTIVPGLEGFTVRMLRPDWALRRGAQKDPDAPANLTRQELIDYFAPSEAQYALEKGQGQAYVNSVNQIAQMLDLSGGLRYDESMLGDNGKLNGFYTRLGAMSNKISDYLDEKIPLDKLVDYDSKVDDAKDSVIDAEIDRSELPWKGDTIVDESAFQPAPFNFNEKPDKPKGWQADAIRGEERTPAHMTNKEKFIDVGPKEEKPKGVADAERAAYLRRSDAEDEVKGTISEYEQKFGKPQKVEVKGTFKDMLDKANAPIEVDSENFESEKKGLPSFEDMLRDRIMKAHESGDNRMATPNGAMRGPYVDLYINDPISREPQTPAMKDDGHHVKTIRGVGPKKN